MIRDGLPDRGHIEGPQETLINEAIEPVPARILLRTLGTPHHVGAQLSPSTGDAGVLQTGDLDIAVPDFRIAGRMGELDLHLVVGSRSPEA